VPAGEIERGVIGQLRTILRSPEIVASTSRAAKVLETGVEEAEVRDALHRFDPLWEELFPAEQARIVQLLVERVDVGEGDIAIRLRTAGLTSFVQELRAPPTSASSTNADAGRTAA
jgi:site-specific DNA recombinase